MRRRAGAGRAGRGPVCPNAQVALQRLDGASTGRFLLDVEVGADEVRTKPLERQFLFQAHDDGELGLTHGEARRQRIFHRTIELPDAVFGPYLEHADALAEPSTWRRVAAAAPPLPIEPSCFEASAWHKADALSHRDGHWVGADGVSLVDFGGGRT